MCYLHGVTYTLISTRQSINQFIWPLIECARLVLSFSRSLVLSRSCPSSTDRPRGDDRGDAARSSLLFVSSLFVPLRHADRNPLRSIRACISLALYARQRAIADSRPCARRCRRLRPRPLSPLALSSRSVARRSHGRGPLLSCSSTASRVCASINGQLGFLKTRL